MSTSAARIRYNRIAPIYDLLESLPELQYRSWRRKLWTQPSLRLEAESKLIEIGVGTGKNVPYWPPEVRITAVDISPRMLVRAEKRARHSRREARFEIGDAQQLNFPDNHFDAAVMSFVMCSVSDPVQGMREVGRIVRPGGAITLLEHVRSAHPLVGGVMDFINPVVVNTMGPNINRDTVLNCSKAGFEITNVETLGLGGIFKLIDARVPRSMAA